ncbi:MAG TPA: aminotransferase class IV [bacterium]|nr:aminotransferase class IV [bacterium]
MKEFARTATDGIIYVNGRFFPRDQAAISVFDHGLLHGDGVFDTLMAWKGAIFKLDQHLDRLFRSARAVKIRPPLDKERIRDVITEAIRMARLENVYIKCIMTRGTSPAPYMDLLRSVPSLIVIAVPYPEKANPFVDRPGVRATIASIRRTPDDVFDSRIKSLNYLPFALARLEALEAGYDEALMLDVDGCVCEAPGWNIFVVRGGEVITPGRSILEGITRETVIEICKRLSIPCRIGVITSYDCWVADEAFLTSTVGGLLPLSEVDGRPIGTGEPGPIFRAIRTEFRAMLEGGEHCTKV